jgi:hypothetical protein
MQKMKLVAASLCVALSVGTLQASTASQLNNVSNKAKKDFKVAYENYGKDLSKSDKKKYKLDKGNDLFKYTGKFSKIKKALSDYDKLKKKNKKLSKSEKNHLRTTIKKGMKAILADKKASNYMKQQAEKEYSSENVEFLRAAYKGESGINLYNNFVKDGSMNISYKVKLKLDQTCPESLTGADCDISDAIKEINALTGDTRSRLLKAIDKPIQDADKLQALQKKIHSLVLKKSIKVQGFQTVWKKGKAKEEVKSVKKLIEKLNSLKNYK